MTRPLRHVVIFAKAPRIGTVKRRLAAGIGQLAAWRCYGDMTRTLIDRLARESRWTLWLAVTPDADARATRFWPRARHCHGIARIGQGRGDLGARMGRVLRDLPRGPAVIVGSDIPGIDAAAIHAAFRELQSADAVFGPAGDGGYWLVGLRRRPRPHGRLPGTLFRGVRWSSDHALADTLAGLPKSMRIGHLQRLDDVDDVGQWRAWRKQSSEAKISPWSAASSADTYGPYDKFG